MLGKTYEDMTLIQLREIAKEIGIKNITKKKKSELIEDIKLNSPKAIEKDGVILKEKIAPKVLEHDIVDNNNENDVFCVIVFLSFRAFAADIAGTNAVAKATFIANGNVVNVSTFPPNIPYSAVAWSSGINFFKFLTTVNESTFLFIDDIIAVNVIGIDTNKIFFIIFDTLSYL